MTYKLLDAVKDIYGKWFDIEIKNKTVRFIIISKNSKIEIIGSVPELHLNYLIGDNTTHLGIPEDLKNYIEDPLFEIELQKKLYAK